MRGKFISGRLRRKGPVQKGPEENIVRLEGKSFVWTDLQSPDRSRMEELAAEYNLNELNVEDSLAKFELPKLDAYPEHIFFILHFPPLSSMQSGVRHTQVAVFMGSGFLITVHQGDLDPLTNIVSECRSGSERGLALLDKSSAVVLHEIIDSLVDDLLHILRRIIASLEEMEDEVFDDKKSVARQIAILRREITMMRRIVSPLKRIVSEAARQIPRFSTGEDLTLYFDDVIDHIDKVIDALEESKETMEIYKDTDFMLNTEKTNKVLAILTIMFTLAIPATVLGTFYGMNVNLPGALEPDGAYGAFAIVAAASVGAAAGMFGYFKKLGWMS